MRWRMMEKDGGRSLVRDSSAICDVEGMEEDQKEAIRGMKEALAMEGK